MNDQGLQQELDEIKVELKNKRDVLRTAFLYYSMISGPASSTLYQFCRGIFRVIGSGSVFQLSLSQWLAFAQECNIQDTKSMGVKYSDLVCMFVSTNFEEDSNTQESEANDDDALVRFEFLEIVVRASFGKYISSKQLNDSSDSVQRLLEHDILPSLPQEAVLDPNGFRRERLYTAEMEALLRRYWEFLVAMFKVYKAADKTKYFSIEHWMTFLESASLLGPHTGIERREAKLIFAWSQMTTVDELKKRHRVVALMFFDFVEALARLAEMMEIPTEEDISAALPSEHDTSGSCPSFAYYTLLKEGRISALPRHNGELPLSFHQLLDYLTEAMKNVWEGTSKEQCTDRMKKMASKLSGGIELG